MTNKNKQKPTGPRSKPHKAPKDIKIHDDPYLRLSLVHQLAVDMRLYNMSHRSIAQGINANLKKMAGHGQEKTTYQENTIREWFMHGGICYAALQYKKSQRAAERSERKGELDNQIVDGLTDAIAQLRAKIEKGNLQAIAELIKIAPVDSKDKPPDPTTTIHFYIPSNGR